MVGLKLGAESVFQTDILKHLIEKVASVSKQSYDYQDKHLSPAFHVIADHLRSLAFSIADGAQPSNLDRGYVLRKTLRRAHRYGKMLNMHQPFLADILPALIEVMGEDYPEVKQSENRISEILHLEEEAFIRTLQKGGNLMQSLVEKAQKSPEKCLSGEDAFKMKDTYGFPLEEIMLLTKDAKISIDLEKYEEMEKQAKLLSKQAHKKHHQNIEEGVYKKLSEKGLNSHFVGYDTCGCKAKVTALLKEGQESSTLTQGQEGWLLLDQTPFYAEKGGQVGDQGMLYSQHAEIEVLDTQNPLPSIIAHKIRVKSGSIEKGSSMMAQVEERRRKKIQANHTATHLMHWALCQVLGDHINQAGSYVDEQRLRFDFNHHKNLSKEEIREIENLVNEQIRENTPVKTYELSYQEVQKQSDIKQFFGDKYGTKVRVVDAGFSKELCGGTHIASLGSIGLFKILKESSISAGVRRIEAITGYQAEKFTQEKEKALETFASSLKVPQEKLLERFEKYIKEHCSLEKELKVLKKQQNQWRVHQLLEKKQQLGNIPCVIEKVQVDAKELKNLSQELLNHLSSGVSILLTEAEERCLLCVHVSEDWIQKGVLANELVNSLAPLLGGKGGGKAPFAQAGGSTPGEIPNALKHAKELIQALP